MEILNTSPLVFLILTCLLIGGASWMTGQAIAQTWRPKWQIYPYCFLLALADRFLHFALFQFELLNLVGLILSFGVLLAIALSAFHFKKSIQMSQQYPWLYERPGLIGYKKKQAE